LYVSLAAALSRDARWGACDRCSAAILSFSITVSDLGSRHRPPQSSRLRILSQLPHPTPHHAAPPQASRAPERLDVGQDGLALCNDPLAVLGALGTVGEVRLVAPEQRGQAIQR